MDKESRSAFNMEKECPVCKNTGFYKRTEKMHGSFLSFPFACPKGCPVPAIPVQENKILEVKL